jgi:hypothetical protein
LDEVSIFCYLSRIFLFQFLASCSFFYWCHLLPGWTIFFRVNPWGFFLPSSNLVMRVICLNVARFCSLATARTTHMNVT